MSKNACGRVIRLLFLSVLLLGLNSTPTWAGPEYQLHAPQSPPVPKATGPVGQDSDILLVMPNAKAEDGDVKDALTELHGTVVGTIGKGPLTVLKVKVEKGKLEETEKKLTQDKKYSKSFSVVQRNFEFTANVAPVNDPFFVNEWHLPALNVPRAWNVSQGSGSIIIAVLDSGVALGNRDLSGRVYSGYDAFYMRNGQTPASSHGTWVATTAAASTNNSFATASPARNCFVYPVKIAGSNARSSDAAVMEAIWLCGNSSLPIKILNISYNSPPPYSFANPRAHPALHAYLKWFHDSPASGGRGGLIFNSAGNDGLRDTSTRLPYLIVISALDPRGYPASFTTYGSPLWFTAPGVGIYCTGPDSKVQAVDGTSFSSPLCAGVAQLVWSSNPGLKNTDVERILYDTRLRAPPGTEDYFGYGLPNAEAAVRRATGR